MARQNFFGENNTREEPVVQVESPKKPGRDKSRSFYELIGSNISKFFSGLTDLSAMGEAHKVDVGAMNLEGVDQFISKATNVVGGEGLEPKQDVRLPPSYNPEMLAIDHLNERLNVPTGILKLQQDAGNQNLPPEIQQQIDDLATQSTAEVDRINAEIEQKQMHLQTGQQLMGSYVDQATDAGLLPAQGTDQRRTMEGALDSIESTMQVEDLRGGLTPELINAITSSTSQFQFDTIMAKTAFEQGVMNEIENLVTQRNDVNSNAALVEAALTKEGQRARDQMPLPTDVPTEQGMFNNTFGQSIASSLDGSGIELNVFQEDLLAQQLTELGQLATLRGGVENIAPELEQVVAQFPGLDVTIVGDALDNAVNVALDAAGAVDQWRTSDVLAPDTPALMGAIQETVLDLQLPEEYLRLVQSESFHTLIQLASNGQVGAQHGVDMAGIGGLTQETYGELGYDYATIQGNAEEELRALVQYIAIKFGGDPVAALESYKRGDWGSLG